MTSSASPVKISCGILYQAKRSRWNEDNGNSGAGYCLSVNFNLPGISIDIPEMKNYLTTYRSSSSKPVAMSVPGSVKLQRRGLEISRLPKDTIFPAAQIKNELGQPHRGSKEAIIVFIFS